MTAPHDDAPVPERTEPAAPAPGSPTLGRIALWLGVGTVACALLQVVFSMIVPSNGIWGSIPMLGIPLGLAAVIIGIVAIVKRRGRRDGIIGLVLAAVAGPVAWGIALAYVMVSLVLHYGV